MNVNNSLPKAKGHQPLINRLLLLIFSTSFIFTGCLKEEVSIDTPKPGAEPFQLHNFNAPLSGIPLEGSAPDIFYFKQKEDGSYAFMITSANYDGFETDWATEYVLVTTDANGAIQKKAVMKLPVNDGIIGTFGRVWDAYPPNPPPNPRDQTASVGPGYIADDLGMLYYTPDLNCYCRNMFFNLHPETGQAEYFETGAQIPYAQIFRTSDGGFIAIGGAEAPDYHKFSASGTLEFKQPMKYWEAEPAYVYLTDKNGEYFFITIYDGPYFSRYFPSAPERFSENSAKSFFYLRTAFSYSLPNTNVEVRFGPGKTQKAHRFNRYFAGAWNSDWGKGYQDYVDVPFEVWDVTDVDNPRQLMASFRDQGMDGLFNLIPMNIDWTNFGAPTFFTYPFNNDPKQSQEWIFGSDIPYSSTPNEYISSYGPLVAPGFLVIGYLADAATWNPSALPPSSVSIKIEPRPGTQILKVSADGSSVVKDNYTLGNGPLHNMFKAVPYLDGFAVLINVASWKGYFPPTQLVLLEANFSQKTVLNMTSSAADREHQLEFNKGKDRIFYARITSNPKIDKDNAFKGSLLLSVIKDNAIKSEKYLDEFIPFKLEKYRMTPTKTGGVTIVAWVRPTKDTRDLLFFELDENLELVKP